MINNLQNVALYYDNTEVDYRMFWSHGKVSARHLGFWTQTTKTHDESLLNHNGRMAELVGITDVDVVLDAGCGVGGSSFWLASRYGIRVDGITLSDEQLKHAERRRVKSGLEHLVSFSNRDYHNTGLPSESYSVVWAQESLSHSTDERGFLQEAFRLLKPGGRLIVSDFFNSKQGYTPDEQRILDMFNEGFALGGGLIHPEKLVDLAIKTGFTSVQHYDHTELVKPSVKRLNTLYWVFTPVREFLGLFYEIRRKNTEAARAVYQGYMNGLLLHVAILAQKPA